MINKDGGGGTIFRFYGGHSCYEGGHGAHGGPPNSKNPERCQDKNEESLFLKQELKFFSQIYQGQAQDSGF